MIPFLASTMFQNRLTSNWRSSNETIENKKQYLTALKFKPMLVKVRANHGGDWKDQLINLSMIKEVRPGWSDNQGLNKNEWCEVHFIDGNTLYVKGNIDSLLNPNDKPKYDVTTTLKKVLGDANPLVDEINSHLVSNEEADEDAIQSKKQAGWITQAILDYVDNVGVASYKELNYFYRHITKGSNSFSHHIYNLITPYKNRPTRRYLIKNDDGKYEVRIANELNWIVINH